MTLFVGFGATLLLLCVGPAPLMSPFGCPGVVHVQAGSGSDGDSEGHDLRRIRPSPVDSSSMRVVGTTGWQAPELLHESLLRSSGSLPQGEDGFTLVGARAGDGPPSGARCVCVGAGVWMVSTPSTHVSRCFDVQGDLVCVGPD